MKIKSPFFLLISAILFQFSVLNAQDKYNQINEGKRQPLFFHELNLTKTNNDSLAAEFMFRISHDHISFIRDNSEKPVPAYSANIKLNIELHFSDSSIIRYSDTFKKSVTDYKSTQNKFEYLTGHISIRLASKPVYYTLDGVDNGSDKVLFQPAKRQDVTKFNITSILDYQVSDSNSESVNFSKNLIFNYDQTINLILSDTTEISKLKFELSRKEINDDEFEIVSDFDPIRLIPVGLTKNNFQYKLSLPSLKLDAGVYRLTILNQDKKDIINFQNLWLDMPGALTNLDLATRVVRYIATPDEYDDLTSGSFDERVKKFKLFWQKKDPTPKTVYNELMTEYFRRVDYAFMNFQSLKDYGWRTDRGKIYILYGEPTSKQRIFPPGEPSEEIWIYTAAKKRFVFADVDGKGEFRLVDNKKK